MKLKTSLAAVASFLLLLLSSSPAAADASPTLTNSPGLAISPAIQQLVLPPNQTKATFQVQLINEAATSVSVSLRTDDFTALNETGGVAFLGGNVSILQKQHGLSSFLQLPLKQLTIPGHTTATIPIVIVQANDLANGGHYGAILAQIAPAGGQTVGNHVTINQDLSSLVFVQTAGKGSETIQLLKPSVSKLLLGLPTSLNVLFQATGNTQTIPRGDISVTSGNRLVETGIINVNSSLILPGSTRLLQTTLTGNAHPWLPGIYHLTLHYHYDGALGESIYETSFIYVNPLLVVVLAGALIILITIVKRRPSVLRAFRRQPVVIQPTNVVSKRVVIVTDSTPEPEVVAVKKNPKPPLDS